MIPRLALGLDIGGTKVEGSLIDEHGRILKTVRRDTPKENAAMLALVSQVVAELAGAHAIVGVGCAIPGSLDPNGILRNAPNSPAIQGTALAADLAARVPFPLAFENDANCLALSERSFGAARGYDHVVGIILGTGLGGGVITAGKVLRGARGLAPEPGHLPLDVKGRPCQCGNRGCAEAYLSGPSLLRRYHDGGGDLSVKDTRELFRRPEDGVAKAVLAETCELFARFVAALVSLYDPQVFVLGGGLSLQPMFYHQQDQIARYSFGTDQVPPILAAQHGDTSGKLGAAALIFATKA